MSKSKSQGAFEYILLLGGILLIVVLIIVILKTAILSPANANVQNTNNILNTISAVPEIPGPWTKYSCSTPVIPVSMAPTSALRVVKTGGVYYGFYTNQTGGPTGQGNIGLLNSTDGVNWQLVNSSILNPSPTGWDNYSVGLPSVIYSNGLFQMWYMGSNTTNVNSWTQSPGESVGYATSTDAIHWTKNSNNPVFTPNATGTWDNYSIAPSVTVINDGGVYKMWYTGMSQSGFATSIGYAASQDGVNWQRWNGTGGPVITNAITGVALKNGVYYLSLGGFSGSNFITEASTSNDGVAWSQPVITLTNSTGCFDSQQAFITSIILSNDQYQAWYYAYSSSPSGVGYATAPVNILTP